MKDGELIGPWAELVVAGLVAGGVQHLVISPGSRSTPFALAALRCPGLTCWSVVDERSAGFFALGQAKTTGLPTALLATSGTAPAHYLPAIIEAHATGTPLVVVTADRPHELIHCGAPQTIEQTRLFGGFARHGVDLGNPEARPAALRGVLRRVLQAVATARGPLPGPVHVNARAAKPLEPVVATSTEGRAVAEFVAGLRREPSLTAQPSRLAPSAASLGRVAARLATATRGLIFCGALSPTQAPSLEKLHELARRTGFPLVCETTSQLRAIPNGDGLLLDRIEPLLLEPGARRAFAPELILQLGSAPLSAGWSAWHGAAVERHVLSPFDWADPTHDAASLHCGDLELALTALLDALAAPSPAVATARREYREKLGGATDRAAGAVEAVLGAERDGLTEGQAVRATLEARPPGSALVLGSSLALRAVDLFCSAPTTRHLVVAHRGVNGIDGLVSTAAGVASVHGATTLLLGDVSFLHDIGGLWAARHLRAPLAIVVLNDGGGRIFGELPVAAAATAAELEYFTTPHDFDLGAAAALYGHRFRRAGSVDELTQGLGEAHAALGVTVVEARLAPGEPGRELTRLRLALAAMFSRELDA